MKKNNLGRKLLTSATLLTGMGSIALAQTPQKPNIILFMVDDMGWQDTSVPFWKEKTPLNKKYQTPHMEQLASEGMKFTQAYACAISSPTRVSLFTGMNAARHRVTNWTKDLNGSNDSHDNELIFPNWNLNGLQPDGTTGIPRITTATPLPQLLHDNGYYTIHCGKGHMGASRTPGAELKNLGFDINIAGTHFGGPGSFLSEHQYSSVWRGDNAAWQPPGLEAYYAPGAPETNLTEAITLETIKALNKRDNTKPFYLYMSQFAVHVPIEKDKRFYQKYIDKGLPVQEAMYASMVEGMDKSLGDLMHWLDENNLTENTIIIFMSDNGGYTASTGTRLRGGTPYTHNLPLNSGKGAAYEGGIRVPMIVKWKGTTTPNTQTDQKVIIEDFFPTILEMAGVKNYQTTQTIDGRSFVPMLQNKAVEEKDLFWHFPNGYWTGPGIGTYSMIRSGDYKLIYWWKNQSFELYNIKEDIGEKKNLIYDTEQKQRIQELAQKLTNFLKKTNAQRPKSRATNQVIIYPNQAKIPTAPVVPKPSNETTEHWYKIHDNRQVQNFWTLNENTKQLKITTEQTPNDTTTADKLFKIVPTTDGKAYKIYARNNKEIPISAANTANNTPLYANATNTINSWILTPSAVATNYYLIATQKNNQQLNSYAFDGTNMVSFWTPTSDNDPGNRWAFTPGFLEGEMQSTVHTTKTENQIKITVNNGRISVHGAEKFKIYTAMGKICHPQKQLPKGAYIIKTGNIVQKIVL